MIFFLRDRVWKRFPFSTVAIAIWITSLFAKLLFNPELMVLGIGILKFEPYVDIVSKISVFGALLFLIGTCVHRLYLSHIHILWIQSFCLSILVAYGLDVLLNKSLVDDVVLIQQEFISLILFSILCLLFVCFFTGSMRKMLRLNQRLFRVLYRGFWYCLLAWLGSVLFFFSIDKLFDLSLGFWPYQFCFIFTFCLCFSLYVLGWFPELNESINDTEIVLSSFYYAVYKMILVPFLCVGSVLFYVYFFVNGFQWPSLLYSMIVSIWSLLLILAVVVTKLVKFPVQSRLISFISRYVSLFYLPIFVVCCLRICVFWSHWGITEFWYIIFLILFWVTGICIYLVLTKIPDLRVVPVSLFVLFCVVTFTFLRPFSIAVSSQYQAVKSLLYEHKLMDKGNRLVFDQDINLSQEHIFQVKEYLFFLERHNSLHLMQPHYPYPVSPKSLTVVRISHDLGLNGK